MTWFNACATDACDITNGQSALLVVLGVLLLVLIIEKVNDRWLHPPDDDHDPTGLEPCSIFRKGTL